MWAFIRRFGFNKTLLNSSVMMTELVSALFEVLEYVDGMAYKDILSLNPGGLFIESGELSHMNM